MPLILSGTDGVQSNSGAIELGTVNAGGTNPFPAISGPNIVNFTGIPSWVKRITVTFSGVSTNGTSNIWLQIGDAGGIETTGYVSGVLNGGTVTATATSTSAFLLDAAVGLSTSDNGTATIVKVSGNTWVCSSILNNGGVSKVQGGTKTLSDTLTQLSITAANGTDLFDAGSINILYE